MRTIKAGTYSALFWNTEQLGKYAISPNVSLRYELKGPINIGYLSAALQRVVEVTPLLNWHLNERDGELYWEENDYISAVEVHEDLAQETDFELTRLNIATGPLYRFALFKVGEGHFHLSCLFHHVVFEARSVHWFISRLSDAYNGDALEVHVTQETIADVFAAQWQRLETLEQLGAADFWKSALLDAPSQNDLPFDASPLLSCDAHLQTAYTFTVEKKLWETRNPLLRRYTLFSVLMATWGALVARYGNQKHVQIVYPVAIGPHSVESYGSAINSLVQVYSLESGTNLLDLCNSYVSLLRKMKTDRDVKHSEWPTERVLSGSSIRCVNVGFAMVGARPPMTMNGCVVTPLPCREQDMGEGEVWLLCGEQEDQLCFQLLYRPSSLHEAQVRQMAKHYAAMLKWAVGKPDQPLSDFPLFTPSQVVCRGVAHEWGQMSLLSGFEQHAQRHPNHIALRRGNETLSYQDLNARANQLALALREIYYNRYEQAMPAEVLIGLCVQDSLSLIPSMLAILKAGASYVPIDPSYPSERQKLMLDNARPVLMVSDVPWPTPLAIPIVLVDAQPDQRDAVLPLVHPDQLAYIIYTSGSTGIPKGVMVTHAAAVNAVQAKIDNDGLDMFSSACLVLSYAFDAAVAVIFSALHAGATLCLPVRKPLCDHELNQLRVTHLTCPAALADWLYLVDLPTVRQLNLGGDTLTGSVLARLTECYPAVTLEYGITEAGIISMIEKRAQPDSPRSIGYPLPNTQAYVLDRFGQLLPIGATGVLHLGGQGLARGYLYDAERTVQSFIPNPFASEHDHICGYDLLYRTGDQARRRTDGRIEFMGRADSQIKLRGYRIELQEVIQAIQVQPGVEQAYACVQQTAAGERLFGYYTATEEHEAKTMLEALRALLPAYAVPHQLVYMPTFPLTPNGKFDLKALPVPELDANNIAAPRDDVEMTLQAIWRTLFPNIVFGIGTLFHDLGGNSLQAMRMTKAIETRLNYVVSLEQVLRYSSIERLAELIRAGGERPDELSSGNVISFQESESANIICIHPAGGTAFCYSTLAQSCKPTVGVYGVQAQGIRLGEKPLPDVQSMAEHYLSQIRHLTARPHVIAGWSLGGYVALEIASRLHAEGNTYTQLVLFDTQSPCFSEGAVQETSREVFVEKLVKFNGIHSGVREDDIDRFHHLYNHNVLSMQRYRASHYDGPSLFIRTEDTSPEQVDVWRKWLPQLRVAPVSGNHWTLMDLPHVQEVARLVQDCLGGENRCTE
ncbi:non-ribosomal peptide synthetase (plasmid) [Serratia marcescens]|nr:non-ribosomal peptide synthetase [Serratia marcescens]